MFDQEDTNYNAKQRRKKSRETLAPDGHPKKRLRKNYNRAEANSPVTSGPAFATSTTSLSSFFDGSFAR
jgi:hypothetical protein